MKKNVQMRAGDFVKFRVGDLVRTGFFGENPREIPRLGVILEVNSIRYSTNFLHILGSNGKQMYLLPEDVELL